MATEITTTKNLRYHMALKSGGSRYIDIENPITDTTQINNNIKNINSNLDPNDNAEYVGVLVGEDYFNGDTDCVVTKISSAEIIEVQKIVNTSQVYSD